ncbi:hydantoinase B/oxoprolinase family protein [Bacillus piscicola]|uniref:hydantoinase B/oxoprolinase family protein n=1 Tax=Bacillus piscicola TaxID=1632684 RepID=UPI001F098B37|nr:hydantoinase B/oxoprolinase family protein [Bacillus piscicola]
MATEFKNEEELVKKFLNETTLFLGPEPDFMQDHTLASITEREKVAIRNADPSVLSVTRSKMQAGTNESFEMLEQIGAAPGAKWGDLISCLFTAKGDLSIVSSGGVLLFAACVQYGVKYIVKHWLNDPDVGVKPGDIFYYNDARYGGVHNTDQVLIMPYFHEGELIAWISTIVHEGENGAVEPGGMPSAAEQVYDQGLAISPIKIGENYQFYKDIVTFFQNSVREPKLMVVDLKAKLYAALRIEQRVAEAIEEYGVDPVIAVLRKTLDDTVDEVKRRVSQWPDGTVRMMGVADSTLRENCLIKVNLELKKKGDVLTLDFRGSSPEFANRPNNAVTSALKGTLGQLFLSYVWPDLPRNQAVLAPMEVIVDEKSVFNPSFEVPNSQSMMTMWPAFSVTQAALAKFLYNSPEKSTNVIAPWYNMITTCIYGGVTQHGETVGNLCADLNGMSGGARDGMDGEHSIAPLFAPMAEQGEQEQIEEEVPIIQLSRRIMKDNQGFGQYRGGQGYQMFLTQQDSDFFGFMTTTIGSKYPSAHGIFGGYGAPTYPLCKIKGVNVFDVLKNEPEKMAFTTEEIMNNQPLEDATYSTHHTGLQFELAEEGEIYIITQGAGGGYGDVLDRDPNMVMKDVEEDLISQTTANDIYKVFYDPETLVLDWETTEVTRKKEREARKKRGVPFNEFINNWVTEKPAEHLPFYGSWSDRSVVYAGSTEKIMEEGKLKSVMMPNPKDVQISKLEKEIQSLKK